MNPFQGTTYSTSRGPLVTYEGSAEDRIRWVNRCDDPALLHKCLRVRGLQKTVRIAIERRLRKLTAGGAQ